MLGDAFLAGVTALSTTLAELPSTTVEMRLGSTCAITLPISRASLGSGLVTTISKTSVEFTAAAEIMSFSSSYV